MVAKRRKKRKRINSKIFKKVILFLIFGILLFFLIYSNFNLIQERLNLKKELTSLNQEQEELKKESESLKFSLGQSYSEAYVEKVAREDMNLKKPGETVFVIKKEGEANQENKEEIKKENYSIVEKIKIFLESLNK